MRSVEARFRAFQSRYPDHSSFIVFGRTIQGQQFSHRTVAFWFSRLVKKDDYGGSDRVGLLRHFVRRANEAEECIFEPKYRQDEEFERPTSTAKARKRKVLHSS